MSGFEVIGAIAAAGQFLEQGIKVIQIIRKLRDQVQNPPSEMFRQQCEKLGEFNDLATQIQSPRSKSLHTEEISRILIRGTQLTDQLAKLFEEMTPQTNAGVVERTWKAVGGLAKEEVIRELFQKIESEKSSLTTFMHIVSIQENEQGFSLVNHKLESLRVAIDPSPEEQKCLRELFVTDPASDREGLLTSKGEIIPGTCEWVESRDEYRNWLNAKSSLLWISGGPGKGKTMLSIHLSKRLEQLALQQRQSGRQCLAACFFCDNKQQSRNTATSIIRGLLYQILKQDNSLIHPLLEAFKVQGRRLFEESSFEALWGVFVSVIRSPPLPTFFVVIDGLDECNPDSLQILLKKFRSLYKYSSPTNNIKLGVISREYPDNLPGVLRDFPRIRLDPDSRDQVSDGIRLYISTRVDELADPSYKNYSKELRQLVEQTLLHRANGTYLWVSFVVQDLETKSASEVEDCLDDLPTGLDEIYERMLAQIPSDKRDITRKILLWTTFAKRPMHLEELADIIGVKSGNSITAPDKLRDLIRHCGHFISVIKNNVTLVHQSAKDFLLQRRPNPQQAQYFDIFAEEQARTELAMSCITYLQSGCLSNQELIDELIEKYPRRTKILDQYPFLRYAITLWDSHAREAGEGIVNLLARNPEFFADESVICHKLKYIHGELGLAAVWEDIIDQEDHIIHFACVSGLVLWVQRILDTGLRKRLRRKQMVNQRGSWGRTPLHSAIVAGHLPVVKLLIKHKAKLDALNDGSYTPLGEATLRRKHDIMRFLLECHADPNIGADGGAKIPLHIACRIGDVESVRILVNAGANPYYNEKIDRTVLDEAVREDSIQVVQFLLEKFSITELGGPSSPENTFNILSEACDAVSKAGLTVRWLIEEAGVMTTHIDWSGRTVLHVAAETSRYEVLQCLIEMHNMDPSQKTATGKTVLHYAGECRYDTVDLVQYLLERRSMDPECADAKGNTVLHCAAGRGNVAIVRYLIEQQNMDPQRVNNTGNTTLHCAAQGWGSHKFETVKYLIQTQNMDPGRVNDQGHSSLHMAAFTRSLELVEWLIREHHVDPTITKDGVNTVLHEAVRSRNVEIVQYLVEVCHLDANSRGSGGKTPLHVLVTTGSPANKIRGIIQTLLRHGADVNLKDDVGLTVTDYVGNHVNWHTIPEFHHMRLGSTSQSTSEKNLSGKLKRIMKFELPKA